MRFFTYALTISATLLMLGGCAASNELSPVASTLTDYAIAVSTEAPVAGEAVVFEVLLPQGVSPVDNDLSFRWQFGDHGWAYGHRVEHTFSVAAEYLITLTIRRNDYPRVLDRYLTVQKAPAPEPEPQPDLPPLPPSDACLDVKIDALLPNPSGPEPADEWIQLRNFCDSDVLLGGWVLATGEHTFTIPAKLFIPYNGTRRIHGSTFNPDGALDVLYLPNTGDTVRLIDPFGNTVHQCVFQDADMIEDVEFLCLT